MNKWNNFHITVEIREKLHMHSDPFLEWLINFLKSTLPEREVEG